MIDPEIQKFFNGYWWFLPACFFVGLFVIYLERKISEFNKSQRKKKNKK